MLVAQGKVTINGQLAELGSRADPDRDQIRVEGRLIRLGHRHHYLALHKPAGYISSRSDPQGRPTVMELVPPHLRKLVYPVGRLDFDSEGLLLLFDDGELANQLIHPRYQVPKRYQALVAGSVGDAALARLRKGVALEDGLTAPAHARVLDRPGDTTVLEVAIHEGRKRQVRRMLETVGHPVRRLVRVAVGGLELGSLPAGAYRELTAAEVDLLRRAVHHDAALAAPVEAGGQPPAPARRRTPPADRPGPKGAAAPSRPGSPQQRNSGANSPGAARARGTERKSPPAAASGAGRGSRPAGPPRDAGREQGKSAPPAPGKVHSEGGRRTPPAAVAGAGQASRHAGPPRGAGREQGKSAPPAPGKVYSEGGRRKPPAAAAGAGEASRPAGPSRDAGREHAKSAPPAPGKVYSEGGRRKPPAAAGAGEASRPARPSREGGRDRPKSPAPGRAAGKPAARDASAPRRRPGKGEGSGTPPSRRH